MPAKTGLDVLLRPEDSVLVLIGDTTTCRDPFRNCSTSWPDIPWYCTCKTRGSAHSPFTPNLMSPMTV